MVDKQGDMTEQAEDTKYDRPEEGYRNWEAQSNTERRECRGEHTEFSFRSVTFEESMGHPGRRE